MSLSPEQLTSLFGQGLRRIDAVEERLTKIEASIAGAISTLGKQNAQLTEAAGAAVVELRALKDAFKLAEDQARSVEVGTPAIENR